MQLGPEGKLAVVTGLAVTTALAAEGAHVIGGARDTSDELSALAETGSVESVVVDLSTPAGPVDLAAGGTDPRPDRHLINNVGGARPRVGGFLSITDDDWAATLNLNQMAAVRMTRAVLPSMIAAGGVRS